MAKQSVPKLSPSQRKLWLILLTNSDAPESVGSTAELPPSIVLDTNILISGIIYGGAAEEVIRRVLHRQRLVLSDQIVSEFIQFIDTAHPKLPRRWRRLIRQKLEQYVHDPAGELGAPVRDINDTDIVRLAITYDAVIVTGDRDLLEYRGDARAVIISINEYFALYG